jgi:peptide/nickel transport system substrate-binding protein
MKIRRRGIAAIAAVTAAAFVLAGCASSGGSSSASSGSSTYGASIAAVNLPSTKTGGTMKLLASADCDSWDPVNTYYGWCWNMQRLFSRTLIGYSKVNGTKFTLTPDLATSLGSHNANFTSWTFKLKSGLKYSTGAAIKPIDIKYAVERMYATTIFPGGPGFYFTGLIAHAGNYAGPYNGGGDLPSSAISTTSNSITFHLSKPFADFDYLLALPTSTPVPYKVEGGKGFVGANYFKHPVSSGPYTFTDYTQKQSVTFVRNKYWSQSTDTIRHPLADKIDLTIDSSTSDIDAKLNAGTYDALANEAVGPTFQTQILTNPKKKAYADDPAGDSISYLIVAPSVIPNKYCREAVFYATDKASLLAAAGGSVSGVIAGSMTPPGIPGYDPKYNPYDDGPNNTGDLAKAKAALVKCGQPNGFSTKYAYATPDPENGKPFQTEQTALARVGIKITPATDNASTYYKTFVGSPSNVKSQGLGIFAAGWGADFPTYYGFYQNIANGAAIAPEGNSNYASVNDPTVNSILDDTSAPANQATGEKLDKALMATASNLPTAYGRNLYYHNPRMTNVTSDNVLAFGIYDFVNAGVNG